MNYTQFDSLIRDMIAGAYVERRTEHFSMTGKRLASNDWPIVDFLVRLPPSYMLEVARNPKMVPMEFEGYPVRIAEGPSRVSTPSNRYLIWVMCRKEEPETGRLSGRGRVALAEEFG